MSFSFYARAPTVPEHEISDILEKRVIRGRAKYLIRKRFTDNLVWEPVANVPICRIVRDFEEELRRRSVLVQRTNNSSTVENNKSSNSLPGDSSFIGCLLRFYRSIN